MKTEERGEEGFKEHLVVLTNGVRLREWWASLCRGNRYDDGDDGASDPLSPSDVLTLGVLLARSSSVGGGDDEVEIEEVESALWRAVARKRLGPKRLHSAAFLADEASAGASKHSEEANEAKHFAFHPWLRVALPELLAALLRSPSPKAWALAEESAPLLARHAAAAAPHDAHSPSDANAIMPLLEALVRSAHVASQAAGERSGAGSSSGSGTRTSDKAVADAGIAGDAAAARVLAAALASVPAATLASSRPWRLLLATVPSHVGDEGLDSFAAVPLASAVGRALARAAANDDSRRVELCNAVEKKLLGNIQARAVGLEMLRAVLCSPEQPLSPPDVQLAVRWALHAASSAKVTAPLPQSESPTESATPPAHRLWVSAAAVLVAAAPYLKHADLTSLRDGWLAPRLTAQALTWRHTIHVRGEMHRQHEVGGTPPVCTVRSHVSIPVGERLHIDAAAALFHADLVLTAYVDPGAFKARVMNGGIELGLTTTGKSVSPGGENGEKSDSDAGGERWGYLMAAAVMTILANLLQSCLNSEHNRDVARHGDVHAEAWRGVSLGLPAADIRRALLHRLSHLLALQRGIEHGNIKSANSSARSPYAVAASSLPHVQVSTWLSAVECVLAEDEPHISSSFAHGSRYDVPDVEPQVQAGILARAAAAVSLAVGLKKDEKGRASMGATDPAYILHVMVTRGILQKSLILAERLAPNVTVASSNAAASATSSHGALPNRYQMLADRLGASRGGRGGSHAERGGALIPLQSTRNYGRWAATSANTRAAIVAGCFELCTVAAQAPASAATEASVMRALAAPVLHLEAWDSGHDDGFTNNRFSSGVPGGDEAGEAWSRRLAVLQWVTARGTECIALRAAAPALSLGATLLLSLPPSAAAACTPMLVTAHASAALWGQTDANSTTAGGGEPAHLFGNPLQFAQDLLQEHMTGAVDGAFLSSEHRCRGAHSIVDEKTNGSRFARHGHRGGVSLERSQRAGLLRTAHHLTLRCNGTDAAISMIADVMHVVSSRADPVSYQAAATATSVVLHLLAAHLQLAVDGARESTLSAFERVDGDPAAHGDSLDLNSITRAGRLMVQTMDAAVMLVNNRSNSKRDADEVDVLRGANAALLSLVSTAAAWTGSSSSVSVPAGRERCFDDVAHAAYQSSGRLGVAVERSAGWDNDVDMKRECANMRLHRVTLRAAAAMRGGARLLHNTATLPNSAVLPGSVLAAGGGAYDRSVSKYRKAQWVDMAAQEPSSDEDGDDGDGDDDAIFCVRPSGAVGIAGWELDDDKPAAAITDGKVLVPTLKRRRNRSKSPPER